MNALATKNLNKLSPIKTNNLNLEPELKQQMNYSFDKMNDPMLINIPSRTFDTIYKKIGYDIILIDSLTNKEDFEKLNKKIYKMGYSRMFIETGLTFLKTLIKNKIIDELFIFKSSNK